MNTITAQIVIDDDFLDLDSGLNLETLLECGKREQCRVGLGRAVSNTLEISYSLPRPFHSMLKLAKEAYDFIDKSSIAPNNIGAFTELYSFVYIDFF